MTVRPGSAIAGKTITEAHLRNLEGCSWSRRSATVRR